MLILIHHLHMQLSRHMQFDAKFRIKISVESEYQTIRLHPISQINTELDRNRASVSIGQFLIRNRLLFQMIPVDYCNVRDE